MTERKRGLQLTVNIQLREVVIDPEGYIQHQGSGGLNLSEDAILTTSGFLEACDILAQFHKLSESFRGKNPREK